MKIFLNKDYNKLLWGIPIDKGLFKFIKEFLKKYTKKLWRIALIISVMVGLIFAEFYYDWLGLGIPLPDKPEEAVAIYRNRGIALAAIIGTIVAIWGRWQTNEQIALNRRANASERYEKAAHMLGDKVLAVRIAGCHALENLGVDDEKMTTQCIQLLATFIRNPFVDKDETDKNETDENETESSFKVIKLSQDVQAAVNGLSAISKYYYKKSRKKVLDKVDLRGANLRGADLKGADLRGANLKGANLVNADLKGADLTQVQLWNANLTRANLIQADLTRANLLFANLSRAHLLGINLSGAYLSNVNLSSAGLIGANLTDANLTDANLTKANLNRANLTNAYLVRANLKEAKDLTKEQIISAIFYDENPPSLSEELLQDEEIQKWIKNSISQYKNLMEEQQQEIWGQ